MPTGKPGASPLFKLGFGFQSVLSMIHSFQLSSSSRFKIPHLKIEESDLYTSKSPFLHQQSIILWLKGLQLGLPLPRCQSSTSRPARETCPISICRSSPLPPTPPHPNLLPLHKIPRLSRLLLRKKVPHWAIYIISLLTLNQIQSLTSDF